jgi:hypothetical protein
MVTLNLNYCTPFLHITALTEHLELMTLLNVHAVDFEMLWNESHI